MRPRGRGWLVVLACAVGCSSAGGGSVEIPIPVVGAQPIETAAPAAKPSFSLGERRLIAHSDVPARLLSCDEERLAWANVKGEVNVYRFGEASSWQLRGVPGVDALALSGDHLYALVEANLRWSLVEYRAGAWSEIARDLRMPFANLAADARHVVWVTRDGDEDALFVLDRDSGRIAPRPLGRAHWSVTRVVVDRGHTFVLAEDSMHTPHLYDVDLDGSGLRALPAASELHDIGAADGVLVGLQRAEEPARSDVIVIEEPRRSIARVVTDFHPSVVVGGGVACFFSSDEREHAIVGCVDLVSRVTRVVDSFTSNWEFLAICGGKHLVWTRPTDARKGWDLVYVDLLR